MYILRFSLLGQTLFSLKTPNNYALPYPKTKGKNLGTKDKTDK